MYCNNCGKQIEEGTLCNKCAAANEANQEPVNEAAPQEEPVVTPNEPLIPVNLEGIVPGSRESGVLKDPENRMFGFGKALTSTILAFIGFIMTYVALIMSTIAPDEALVVLFLSMPLIIIPLIMGISSIKVFKARKSTCAKPIATLILGITGLSTAATSAFFAFMTFILSIVSNTLL